MEWGQAKAKDAKQRILRPDYTNEMFVYTSGPHKLLGDTVKKSYEMSDTSIIAAVVAECERMRSAASAHCTADSIDTSSHQLKFCGVEITTSVSCRSSHHQHLGTRTRGTPSHRTQSLDQFTKCEFYLLVFSFILLIVIYP